MAADAIDTLLAERDAAHAAGRKEALEEAASLIGPHPNHDQSDWTEYAHDCNNLANRIRALQHTGDTPQ